MTAILQQSRNVFLWQLNAPILLFLTETRDTVFTCDQLLTSEISESYAVKNSKLVSKYTVMLPIMKGHRGFYQKNLAMLILTRLD